MLDNMSSLVAPWTLVLDALLLLLVVLLCLLRHFHPLVVLRELLADVRPLLGLFVVILFVFANLFALVWYVGDGQMHYGVFSHFFNVVDQHVVMEGGGGSRAFFVACLTAIAGNFLLSGVFVSVLVNVLDSMASRVSHGLISPRIHPGCVAILGYRAGMAEALLLRLQQEPERGRHIVLLTEEDVPKLRLSLRAALPDALWKQLRLVHGGWSEQEDLRRMKLWRCRDIYLLGEDGEANHDSLSLKALDAIQQLLATHGRKEGQPKPVCHILWEEWGFFNLMLSSDISRFISGGTGERLYDVRTYHQHSMLATNVLVAKGWHEGDSTLCPPLDRVNLLQQPGRRVHFIIMGMSSFGQALLRAAILQVHYPNYAADKSRRSRITIIDPQAQEQMERLRNQRPLYFARVRYEHRSLAEGGTAAQCWNEDATLLDTELCFVSGRLESQSVRDYLVQAAGEEGDLVTVAVCCEDSTLSLKTAMHLPAQLRQKGIPVYVHQTSEENLLQHNLDIRRRAGSAHSDNSNYQRKYHQTSAGCSNLYPVGCMEKLFEGHSGDFSLPQLFHRIYSCTAAQMERRRNGESHGLAAWEQLCAEAQANSYAPTGALGENGSGLPGSWEHFFARTLALGQDGDAQGDGMEQLPLILHWSNRYLAEAQEGRQRQYPAVQGESEEEQWKSVLHWLPAMQEAEHQRWMAERLLNEDPLKGDNPCFVPLEDLSADMRCYDAMLCLASYLVAARAADAAR